MSFYSVKITEDDTNLELRVSANNSDNAEAMAKRIALDADYISTRQAERCETSVKLIEKVKG